MLAVKNLGLLESLMGLGMVGVSVREILEGILIIFLLLVEGVGFFAKGTGFILS